MRKDLLDIPIQLRLVPGIVQSVCDACLKSQSNPSFRQKYFIIAQQGPQELFLIAFQRFSKDFDYHSR
jgi:hypothetical protein